MALQMKSQNTPYQCSPSRILVFIDGIFLRGYVLINLDSQFETDDVGFEIEIFMFTVNIKEKVLEKVTERSRSKNR
jgi:hypothetical protein